MLDLIFSFLYAIRKCQVTEFFRHIRSCLSLSASIRQNKDLPPTVSAQLSQINNSFLLLSTSTASFPTPSGLHYPPSSDPEAAETPHRWTNILWYKSDFTPLPKNQIYSYLAEWIGYAHSFPEESFLYSPYAVSERISNLVVLLRYHQMSTTMLDHQIYLFLESQVHYLTQNLEYTIFQATGNHPLNNARALHLFSSIDHSPVQALDFSLVAKAIVLERLDNIMSPNGILREGSVHYQFIITYWLACIYSCLSKSTDTAYYAYIRKYLTRSLRICQHYSVRQPKGWLFPCIGDVSPDIPPQFLSSLAGWNPSSPQSATCTGVSCLLSSLFEAPTNDHNQ